MKYNNVKEELKWSLFSVVPEIIDVNGEENNQFYFVKLITFQAV